MASLIRCWSPNPASTDMIEAKVVARALRDAGIESGLYGAAPDPRDDRRSGDPKGRRCRSECRFCRART